MCALATIAILDFKNFKFLTVGTVKKVECITVSNFVEIAVTAAYIWCLWIFQHGGRRIL